MTTRESEVRQLVERQELLNMSPDLAADISLLRQRFGISPNGIVSGILAEHPEYGEALGELDEAAAERERRILSDPNVVDAVEELVAKYGFPLRHYFAERLLYEEPWEVGSVDEDLAEYELDRLAAAETGSTRPPLWTGFNPL